MAMAYNILRDATVQVANPLKQKVRLEIESQGKSIQEWTK